jgi:hypothetical protein
MVLHLMYNVLDIFYIPTLICTSPQRFGELLGALQNMSVELVQFVSVVEYCYVHTNIYTH